MLSPKKEFMMKVSALHYNHYNIMIIINFQTDPFVILRSHRRRFLKLDRLVERAEWDGLY